MKTKLNLFAGILLLTLVPLSVSSVGDSGITPTSLRKIAPDFALQDATGASLHLSDYKGKVVLLDFWATWCHGCKTEIPWYVEFVDKYKDLGFAAIGVSMDDDGWKSVKPFLIEHKINYPVVIGNGSVGKEYNVEQMPVTLLIDGDGRIAESHAGVVDKDAFESDIRQLLRPDRIKVNR